MTKVNIKILMDKNPTSANKKILEFLMNNVNEYKMYLGMSISTISRKHRDSLDSKIKSLPAAYIGNNTVIGYENVIRGISAAYKNCKMKVDNDDPIQAFWEKNIKDGLGEKTKKNTEDELSVRFTSATKNRNAAINSRAGRFKGGKAHMNKKNNSDDDEDDEGENKENNNNSAPKDTAEMMQKNISSTDLKYDDDPSEFETDPHMKMFWENQKHTPGCD